MKIVSFAHHDMGKRRDLGSAPHDVSDGVEEQVTGGRGRDWT